jgi:outer membrane protein assembly factor BamB
LKSTDNVSVLTKDIAATISGDTIQLRFDSGTVISSLTPTILYKGKTIDPANHIAADFSKPLKYTVTAEDGSTKDYHTAVSFISIDKNIVSFSFRMADNPSVLTADIAGVFQGDSIFLSVPAGTPVNNLNPFIVITGKSISPASAIPQDFSSPVSYTVTADNGTTKNYIVKVIVSARAVYGTVFFVGMSGNASAPELKDSGRIYALDAGTGKLKWKFVDDRYLYSEPTVANGMLYMSDARGDIFTLDVNTGNRIWTFSTAPTQFYNSNTVVSNNTAYVCGSDSTLYALNALTGTVNWTYKDAWGSPTVSNGTVYCMSQGIVAVNATTGVQRWKSNPSTDTSYSYPSNPAVVNGILYVGCTDFYLYALDANTGNLLWRFQTGNVVETSPTVVNGVVYLTASAGTVYALDALTGQPVWNFYVGNSVFSSPMVANGVLYFGSNNQYLYALDAQTGTTIWTKSDGNWINESPLFFQNVIYVGAQDEFQAVDAKTGEYIWRFSDGYRLMLLPCAVDTLGHVFHTSDSGDQN